MVQLTPEALGCAPHTEKLLRQRIHVAYPASEILEAVRLVGEQSLLLVIQFTREQHLAHVGGGDFGFTANGVLAGSVGPGSPHVLGHGCLAAPAAPLGNDCSRQRCQSFCASCLKSLRVCTLQSCGFLKQYQGKGMHILDCARGKPEVVGHSQNTPQDRKSRKHCKDTSRKGDLHETEEPPGRIGSDP